MRADDSSVHLAGGVPGLGRTLIPPIHGTCDWGYSYFDRASVSAPEEGVNPLAQGAEAA